jgi:hypothetical protein
VNCRNENKEKQNEDSLQCRDAAFTDACTPAPLEVGFSGQSCGHRPTLFTVRNLSHDWDVFTFNSDANVFQASFL